MDQTVERLLGRVVTYLCERERVFDKFDPVKAGQLERCIGRVLSGLGVDLEERGPCVVLHAGLLQSYEWDVSAPNAMEAYRKDLGLHGTSVVIQGERGSRAWYIVEDPTPQ